YRRKPNYKSGRSELRWFPEWCYRLTWHLHNQSEVPHQFFYRSRFHMVRAKMAAGGLIRTDANDHQVQNSLSISLEIRFHSLLNYPYLLRLQMRKVIIPNYSVTNVQNKQVEARWNLREYIGCFPSGFQHNLKD